ncbi:CDF family Co(II)/Ni(II) efflux transporter DmeF [Hyphomicrobium sp.]|uniref:CDF family Co(II)/Ni(II) efflux transporter DmeF n=1 Tax=Hyphomicrobium sp. TaxID=82 RepID=UPI001D26FEE8|nr:CDF family Co(II)/Ni(II) efflux transporter DmeF [Hyphomicrobium sp.]MBY0560063.1 CDF family Co(II)/Ni(II) efflux transporter DmeF [Hyphomicrobium sp.]
MISAHVPTSGHDHVFLGSGHDRNEYRTSTMMAGEIIAGTIFGSMALVADGWHMATHAAAMIMALVAYYYARRNARNARFTFGTGKMGDLAGFASAIVLALIAVLIGWESLLRLAKPVQIDFHQAIAVAVLGLAVNIASAWLLRNEDHHDLGHSHDHAHHQHHHGKGQDNNLRAAYVHVLADALTSVLAIVALTAGSLYGWIWLDPVMGVVGAIVIANWSWGLIRDAGGVLLDYNPSHEELPGEIRHALETPQDQITDLHVWQLGPGHHGAIIALKCKAPRAPSHYREKLSDIHELSHVTIEVEPFV